MVWKDEWGYCAYVWIIRQSFSRQMKLSSGVYLCTSLGVYVCVCLSSCVCACLRDCFSLPLCVWDRERWEGEKKMRGAGNEGEFGAEDIKAISEIIQILCLTRRKKIYVGHCKGVRDVLIFQTPWTSCYVFSPTFQVPSNLKKRWWIHSSLPLLTNEDSSPGDGNGSSSELF